jgi:drug/metabolite transporter (DMT)-like permease
LIAMLCWGSGPVFIYYLTGHLDAWSQNFWRYMVATIFWLPFLLFGIRKGSVNPAVWKLAIIPSLTNVAMQCCWGWTFYFIEPGFGGLLARSSLIWTTVFSIIYFSDERGLVSSRQFWAGLLLSIAGLVAVIVARQDFAAKATLTGIVLMLAAGVIWATYSVAVRIAFRDIDSRTSFSVVSLYTTIGLAIIAVIFGRPAQVFTLSAWPWACVVISGILSIALAHTFYYSSIRRIGATIPAIVLQLNPFVTLLLSMMVFGERLNLWQWISGVVLVAGSVLSIWSQQHLKKPDTDI